MASLATAAAALTITGAALAAGLSAAPAPVTLEGQQAQVRELEAQLISLDAEAGAAADAHSTAATRLQEARAAVRRNTRDLKLARENRAVAVANLERRLVAIYRTQQPNLAEILLGSGGLNDTLDQIDLLRRAGEQDREVLASVKETRSQLVRSRDELIRLRTEADDQEREARERKESLERLLGERRVVLEGARAALASAQLAQADRLRAAQVEQEQAIRERAEPGSGGSRNTATVADRPPSDVSAHLARIAQCESGGNPSAISPSGLYRGKYQFHTDTWRSVGGTGDPAAASEAEQDKRAAILYARQGASPWPICGS